MLVACRKKTALIIIIRFPDLPNRKFQTDIFFHFAHFSPIFRRRVVVVTTGAFNVNEQHSKSVT
jgi:hypothetical protein